MSIHAGRHSARERGFSLVELLVAMALVSSLATGVTQLFVLVSRSTRDARSQTTATILAAQKMEQLRALTWGDAQGLGPSLTDDTTDLGSDPPTSGGRGLLPAPAGSLSRSTAGYVDYLDGFGGWVGGGAAAPTTAVFIRRWSITSIDENTLIFQVLVTTVEHERRRTRASSGPLRLADDGWLVSVKTRKAGVAPDGS